MKLTRLLAPVTAGLLLVVVGMAGLALASDPPYREAPLSPDGYPLEVHVDENGRVWISEYNSGKLWQVEPASGIYTTYHDLPTVADARPGPGGFVWWNSYNFGWLGRLDLSTNTVITRETPLTDAWGLAFDGQGRVWSVDAGFGYMTRYDPGSNQSCLYERPTNGISDYVLYTGGYLWMVDIANSGLARMHPDTGDYVLYSYDTGFDLGSYGLAADQGGRLWWGDYTLGAVARFDPADDSVVSYYSSTLLTGPAMLALHAGRVWVSDDNAGLLAAIDPASAPGTTWPVTPISTTLTPDCVDAGAGISYTAQITTGVLNYTTGAFTSTLENGITHYHLPPNSRPWGLASLGADLWVADYERNVLIIVEGNRVWLPIVMR